MDLQYERIGQLVVISSLKKDASVLYNLDITVGEIGVDFLGYVKSQVHLFFPSYFDTRKLDSYVRALRSLRGETRYSKYEYEILRFFYEDMAKFLINNLTNVKLKLNVNTSLDLESEDIDVVSAKNEILHFLNDENSFSNPNAMRNFKYSTIFDYVNSREDALAKIDSYSVAAVLLEQCAQEKLKKINLVWNESR